MITGRDLFMRRTRADGKSHVEQYRVYDVDRFMEARVEEARASRDDPKLQDDKSRLVEVALATVEEYRAERKRGSPARQSGDRRRARRPAQPQGLRLVVG